jgi:arsenite/tail-anchored protein-transporting ATPase
MMSAGDRKFYLLGGKGGVGKTTMSAALAVHMATQEVPTLIVSTDPAHSLSDSLAQDVSGGAPVRVQGTEAPLWGMEIDPEKARQELRELAQGGGGDQALEMLSNVGLGFLADQLKARSLIFCVSSMHESVLLGTTSLVASSQLISEASMISKANSCGGLRNP